MTCPICAGSCRLLLDRRERVPVMMHTVYATPDAAKACARGDIDLVRCLDCGFAWNAAFDPDRMRYGPDYDNCQTNSAAFRAHVDACAHSVLEAATRRSGPGRGPAHIVEVGAGQGTFLARLAELAGAPVDLTGFDPAWRGADGTGPAGSRIYRHYFTPESARLLDRPPDIVVSRHTIEHVEDPLAFLRAIRATIGPHLGVELFVETPDIDWIVRHGALEDVFYEHCSIFDPASLTLALERAGFGNVTVETRFGDQYLWARARSVEQPAPQPRSRAVPNETLATGAGIAAWRERLAALVEAGGRVVVWGAGAKGMTFAQIIDPDARLIPALVDINPGKQGRFVGVTGHPIVAPAALAALAPTHAVVMNPVYTAEIQVILAALGLAVALLPLHEM